MTQRIRGAIGPAAVLLFWEIMARIGWLDSRFFPPPSKVLVALSQMLMSGELLKHTAISLGRVAGGFLLGSAGGLCVGFLLGVNRVLRGLFGPVVDAFYPLPKTALLPLVLLVFGLGEASRLALIAIGVFFLVAINTTAGIATVDKIYIEVGRSFGAQRLDYLRSIVIPAALPQIVTGLRLAWGIALVLIVVAELVGTQMGIGYLMWQSWQIFAVPKMYVGLFVVGFLGAGSAAAIGAMERKFIPWKQ